MSAITLAEKGLAAVQARNWAEAIPLLSKAIDQSKSPQWLLARSQAYMESGDLDRALRDAEYAYCVAVERGNDKSRKQMIEAQHRRSVVYFRRKLFANADVCATWAQELSKGTAVKIADHTSQLIDDKGFYQVTKADLVRDDGAKNQGESAAAKVMSVMAAPDSKKHPYAKDYEREWHWRQQLVNFLEPLPADDSARKVTAKLVPSKPNMDDKTAAKPKELDPELEAAKTAAREVPKPEPSNGPFRSDFYQSDKSCTASLFMKFPSKEEAAKVQVDIQPNLITISGVPREPSTTYIIPHAAVDPTKSSSRTALMKIELTLVKAQPGKWPTFGREELSQPDASALPPLDSTPAVAAPAASSPAVLAESTKKQKSKAPAYPTSSKSGPKDWDGITKDEDEEEGGVDDFFKKLYGNSTDDQKRAMMKSFQESNGTTLSTNWDEVGAGPVATNPPDGVIAKKWNPTT